jgi:hypothetical protein
MNAALVADLQEADEILALAQNFDDAVDAVPREPEDDVDPPIRGDFPPCNQPPSWS